MLLNSLPFFLKIKKNSKLKNNTFFFLFLFQIFSQRFYRIIDLVAISAGRDQVLVVEQEQAPLRWRLLITNRFIDVLAASNTNGGFHYSVISEWNAAKNRSTSAGTAASSLNTNTTCPPTRSFIPNKFSAIYLIIKLFEMV